MFGDRRAGVTTQFQDGLHHVTLHGESGVRVRRACLQTGVQAHEGAEDRLQLRSTRRLAHELIHDRVCPIASITISAFAHVYSTLVRQGFELLPGNGE